MNLYHKEDASPSPEMVVRTDVSQGDAARTDRSRSRGSLTICVHQTKEPSSFFPAVFLDLLCLSSSSLLVQLTEKASDKKGKAFVPI